MPKSLVFQLKSFYLPIIAYFSSSASLVMSVLLIGFILPVGQYLTVRDVGAHGAHHPRLLHHLSLLHRHLRSTERHCKYITHITRTHARTHAHKHTHTYKYTTHTHTHAHTHIITNFNFKSDLFNVCSTFSRFLYNSHPS